MAQLSVAEFLDKVLGITVFPQQMALLKHWYGEELTPEEEGIVDMIKPLYSENKQYRSYIYRAVEEFLEGGGSIEELWGMPAVKEYFGVDGTAP